MYTQNYVEGSAREKEGGGTWPSLKSQNAKYPAVSRTLWALMPTISKVAGRTQPHLLLGLSR